MTDEFSSSYKCGYVWEEIKSSPKLTETFNKLDTALLEFAQGARGPEGVLLREGYKNSREIESFVAAQREAMKDPVQRKFNICSVVDAMLDDDENFTNVQNVEAALKHLKHSYKI